MHRAAQSTLFAAPALLVAAVVLSAQAQPTNAPPPDPLMQLMMTQPNIEIAAHPVATAAFDPPVIRPGELSTYRVTFNALDDSIRWPAQVLTPPALGLRFGARGQILVLSENRLKPQTTINHHVRPARVGAYTIEPFTVEVYGQTVTVPAARLDVVPPSMPAPPPGRRLAVELAATNIFVGQSVDVRVSIQSPATNVPLQLVQVMFKGDGFLVDHIKARRSLAVQPQDGFPVATSTYEAPITPLTDGELRLTAQGFASMSPASGAVVVSSQPGMPGVPGPELLLDAEPIAFRVRPLPQAGVLPGYTGAIGTFTCDPPHLSTSQAKVGDVIRLTVTLRGQGNLARLVPPPPPLAPDWQVSSATLDGPPRPEMETNPTSRVAIAASPSRSVVAFTYNLTPLTAGLVATPAIPFCSFDPDRAAYVDLTIPPVPLQVSSNGPTNVAHLWAEAGAAVDEPKRTLTLSPPAAVPGRMVNSLVPLQQRGGFVLVQLAPVIGFAALWGWDRRRRYLERHPDIVRRGQARRALRRERRALRKAIQADDPLKYAEAALRAMRLACAPHFPAEPRALVCRDVLELVGEGQGNGDTVRRFFAVEDAARFSDSAADARGLLALRPGLERVLQELEARL